MAQPYRVSRHSDSWQLVEYGIEISILDKQCLNRRIPTEAELISEAKAWEIKVRCLKRSAATAHMSRDSYNTDSLLWQARQTMQRFREWIEYQVSQWDVDPPDLPHSPWSRTLGQGLFWLLTSVLVIWLIWLICRALAPTIRQWLKQDRQWLARGVGAPSPVATHSPQYWWRQAQVHAQQGNYQAACRALYRATLQQLNDTQTLLHDPSRTDGEYLQSLENSTLFRPYQLIIRTHERLTFSWAIASAEMFQRCRRAYKEIHKK